MAIALNAAVLSETTAGSAWTSSGTITATGSNTYGLVILGGLTFDSLGSEACTWGGVSMTKRWSYKYTTDQQYTLCFTLIAPPSSASSIVVTGIGIFGMCSAFTFTGVDQVTGHRSIGTTAQGTGNTATSDAITSAANDVIVYGLGSYNNDPAVGAGQTQIAEGNNGGTSWGSASYEVATGASETGSYTNVGSLWVINGISLIPAAPQVIPRAKMRHSWKSRLMA